MLIFTPAAKADIHNPNGTSEKEQNDKSRNHEHQKKLFSGHGCAPFKFLGMVGLGLLWFRLRVGDEANKEKGP